MGKLLAICTSPKRGTVKTEVPSAVLTPEWGIISDAHGGSWHRQVSLLSAEKIEAFRKKLWVDYGAFGENLVIEGFDFRNLPVTSRFAIGSVVLQGAVNGLGSSIVAAQTAGGKAAQFLSVPLESIGTAMTTYASQNMGAHDLKRVDKGVTTALGIGCVYSVVSFLILRVMDVPLISLFLESSEVEIMANARSFIFWNSLFYIPLAVLIIYRYTIQGLGYSGLAMFAGVAEMVARVMVGCWFVPLWGYFAACIANPVAWFFACFFLIPAYFAVRKRLTKELAAARVED